MPTHDRTRGRVQHDNVRIAEHQRALRGVQETLLVREELQNPISSEFISASKHSNFENRTESAESGALERNEPFGEE
jgi:hypothetical protein